MPHEPFVAAEAPDKSQTEPPGRSALRSKSYKPVSGGVVPFGVAKGKPLREATVKQLEWLRSTIKASLADPDKSAWHARNKRQLGGVAAELVRRAGR
jgi:hypothetical protein